MLLKARQGLGILLALGVSIPWAGGALAGTTVARRSTPRATPPALKPLLRSFEAYVRDLDRLDQVLPGLQGPKAAEPKPLQGLLKALPAPAPQALPSSLQAVTIQRRLTVSLEQSLALAVQNDPTLQQQVAQVREQQGYLRSVRGRFFPILSLDFGGGYRQAMNSTLAYAGNTNVPGFGPSSPFFVPSGGRLQYQENVGAGFAALRLDYDLVSFERSAALGQVKQDLLESEQRYGNRLRQLQLDVSEAYYRLQLADQLRRIRQVVTDNDTVIYDQVLAMKTVGLVPRVDLMRAQAVLQQSKFLLDQAEAQRLSGQRRLSNLINVPFDVTLVATEAVRLQPPWPLDLHQTLLRGFQDNPQLEAINSARAALLKQADRRAAELLPRLGLFARGGYDASQITSPLIDTQGCCKSTLLPGANTQSSDWVAGVLLNWRLFDAGITAGAVQASRAAADRTAQFGASERNAIRQRLEAAYYDHRASLSQIIAANASFRAAREAYRDSRARYEFGLADYTDLSDTIRSVTTAMEQRASAITLANVSYAQLLRELLAVPTKTDQPVELPLVLPPSSR